MTAGPGHNSGPSMEAGQSWRRHCWTKARAELIPHLPIEILRGRVRRAQELGLDYKTYASVRASTGRDVIGFLFSSNALRAFRQSSVLAPDRVDALSAIKACKRIALVSQPLSPELLLAANPGNILDAAGPAPDIWNNWSQSRQIVLSALKPDRLPSDAVLLVGDTSLEREWSEAGRLAGYLSADRYFVNATP